MADSNLKVSTVMVRIINGKMIPCNSCYWFNQCLIPQGRHLANINQPPSIDYYKCEEYTSKKP